MFTYSYRNTSGSLGEGEIEAGTRVFPRNFEFSRTSASVSINYGNGGHFREHFVYKITVIENKNMEIVFFIKA